MEYSKDIVLETKFTGGEKTMERGKGKFLNAIKEHKLITLVTISCSMLIVLDYILVHSFIELLQQI